MKTTRIMKTAVLFALLLNLLGAALILPFACEPGPAPPHDPIFESCITNCVPFAGNKAVRFGNAGAWHTWKAEEACHWHCKWMMQQTESAESEE